MIEIPTRDDLIKLGARHGRFSVSLYMPTASKGAETVQNKTRLKNLLREAERKIIALGGNGVSAGKQLAEVRALVDNHDFIQHQSESLAMFIAPDGSIRKFRVPLHLDENVLVNERFHVKPLMQLFNTNGRFYLLAISQKYMRLFEGDRYGLRLLKLPEGTPLSLAEAMKYEDWERGHHMSPGGQGRSAGGVQPFSGHGADASDKEIAKHDMLQFLHMVNKGVMEVIGKESAPLILGGLEYVHHIGREAISYSHLVKDQAIMRLMDDADLHELHGYAWQLLQPRFHKEQEVAVDRFNELKAKGMASSNIIEVVPAAAEGRIDTLMVSADEHCWGMFERDSRKVTVTEDEQSADGEDLLDLAAMEALSTGARVFSINVEEMPEQAPVAAVFRY